jgi:hypothetical protein
MKNYITPTVLVALATNAFAQLTTLPPSSTTDGVSVVALAGSPNAGVTHWEDPSDLAAYRFASDDTLENPNMSSPDNRLGLSWGTAPNANVTSFMNQVNAQGGTIRSIFTGESGGWLNDFGYTYSGNPAGPQSYTVFQNIRAGGGPGTTVTFGDSFDIQLDPGQASTFDFWLNGAGVYGPDNAVGPTTAGGVYTVFRPSASVPYNSPGNVYWAQSPIFVNTWVQSLNGGAGGYMDVATWLVGIEDWRLDRGSDADYNDFMFGIQIFNASGTPFTPVPEPSTYGLIGAAALAALVLRRRFATKKA